MAKKILFAVAVAMASLSAFAGNHLLETHSLKGGAVLYVFGDGKMGMEDQYGRAVRMSEGQLMVTSDGKKIEMKGDEVARVNAILFQTRGAD
jgi:hypothetical protein